MGDTPEFISRLSIADEKARVCAFDNPHDEQISSLEDFSNPEATLVVHTKPRQIGDTTVATASNFDYCYRTADAVKTLIVADSDDTNDAIFQRIRMFHDELPSNLQRPLMRSNKKELIFSDTRAGLRVLTAGGRSQGRGWTYQRLHADELAFWTNAKKTWASVTSTMHEGPHSKTIIISTPNGPGNLYYEKVLAAQRAVREGDRSVIFRFFKWSDHRTYRKEPPKGWEPEEADYQLGLTHNLTMDQLYWRWDKIHGPKGIGGPLFRREFPLTVEEGFAEFDGGWFDVDYLNNVMSSLLPVTGDLRIYEEPQRGMTYAMGIDGSWCNGGDDAVAQVLSRDGRQVAVLATNQGGEILFAQRAAELAHRYNGARVLAEANKGGGGKVIIDALNRAGVKLWSKPYEAGEKVSVRPRHWVNSRDTNTEVYAHARQMINGDALTLNDIPTVQQLMHIKEIDGKIEGAGEGSEGKRDDYADALVLAEWNRRTLPAESLEDSEYRRKVRAQPNPFNPVRQPWQQTR